MSAHPVRMLACLVWLAAAAAGCALQPARDAPSAAADPAVLPTPAGLHHVPAVPVALDDALRPYRQTREAALQGWAGDSVLIATRLAEQPQLHRVAAPLGMREQLTFDAAPTIGAWVQPGQRPRWLLHALATDRRGACRIRLVDLDDGGGQPVLIDQLDACPEVRWDPAGARFAYAAGGDDGPGISVRSLDGDAGNGGDGGDAGDGGTERWLPLDGMPGALRVLDWHMSKGANEAAHAREHADVAAVNDDTLLIRSRRTDGASALIELDLTTGAWHDVLDPALTAMIGTARYSADGRSIYFTSDMGAEFMRLYRLTRSSGRLQRLAGDSPHDVDTFAVAADGTWVAYTINAAGLSRLAVNALDDGRLVALPELPAGVISNLHFHPDGRRLAFDVSRFDAPADVYSIDLDRRTLERWTRGETGGLPARRFVAPETAAIPLAGAGADAAQTLPALVYRPRGPGPHPVLIQLHGEPGRQFRPGFAPAIQAWVDVLGVAVVTLELHGSAGYGKTFRRRGLDEDSMRSGLTALMDWLTAHPNVFDSRRVAVAGSLTGPLPALLESGALPLPVAAALVSTSAAPKGSGERAASAALHEAVASGAVAAAVLVAHDGGAHAAPHERIWSVGTGNASVVSSWRREDDYVAAATAHFLIQFLVGGFEP